MRHTVSQPTKKLLPALLVSFVALLCFVAPASSESDAAENELAPSPLIGQWTLTIPAADGLQNPELVIYQKGSKLKGWVTGPRGKMRLKKIIADGNQFTFIQIIPIPNESLKLTFKGTVQGDKLQGTMSSKKFSKLPFVGVRKSSED